MNIQSLLYLLAIEEEGSVSKAAEKTGITQSALSQALSKANTEAGTPLFERKNGKMIPTPAGKIYLDGAREMIALQQETLRKIDEWKQKDNCIKIAATVLIEPIIQEIIEQVRSEYPDISVLLFTAGSHDILLNYEEHMVDAIIYTSLKPVKEETVLSEDTIVYAVPDAMYKPDTKLSDYRHATLILPPERSVLYKKVSVLSETYIKPSRTIETKSYRNVFELTRNDYGTAFIPNIYLKHSRHLHALPIPEDTTFFLCVRHTGDHPVLERIQALLQQRFAQ